MSGHGQENFHIDAEFAERKKLSKDELLKRMDDWAASGRYDKQMVTSCYIGPKVVADAIAGYYIDNREFVQVMDIAAGTGAVANELIKLGFKKIDAIDPSKEMMKVALSRNLYQNYFNEYVDGRKMSIVTDSYDCVVICGGLSEGYIPTNGIFEILRIVKIGGIIAFTIPKFYEFGVEEFRGRLMPLFDQLEKHGDWKQLRKDTVPALLDNVEAWRFVFKVLVSESSVPRLPENGKK
ncbi:hypothetical protein LOTGIDRAFT_238128 [Lottia gigantea]|uniref:Methyltransferase domain-containing protein n=1 Tax=Lottia gigantea TaxID=225164 RepID=V4AWC5_LOTGI|nr:hypothetical protein LOTGIDRAFT_238128 [Lottia gigantea]ESP01803.1 hypothetical protein LOTGIDRAFT_238128 [Lottia gigantea]